VFQLGRWKEAREVRKTAERLRKGTSGLAYCEDHPDEVT
jgi:hypothetical protein